MVLKPPRTPSAASLICFPYAGGNPDMFRTWLHACGEPFGLVAVRLPGRGPRVREKPYDRWEALLEDLMGVLAPWLSAPHAFYGHSFGGRVAFELAHLTARHFPGRTRHLFVSGCRSPDYPQGRPFLHRLPDDEFRAALHRMGGTPPEVLDSDAMMRLMLPVLRSEIKLSECWEDWHSQRIGVPITAWFGRVDPIDHYQSMIGWKGFTKGKFEIIECDGGHFFLHDRGDAMIEHMRKRLGDEGEDAGYE